MNDKDDVPTPGSPEGVKRGCACPRYSNAHGKGCWGTHYKPDGEKLFTISGDCPLHGVDSGYVKRGGGDDKI